MRKIVTRFAPSPTGYLHIGSARTALFNYLFAKKHHGKFLLRVEDTDSKRNSLQAVEVIIEGLKWFGLNWDGEIVFQSQRIKRHQEIVKQLLASGKAYKCFLTPQEIEILKQKSLTTGKPLQSPWRDRNDHPDLPFTIRLKTPQSGLTIVNDVVQGAVITDNEILDDLIIMRTDGTPTYMLAVVVDDHDMGVTHIIRGDDHLTNTAKQLLIYNALDWYVPVFAHIPLIHDQEGKKLSKRTGAASITDFQEMGYIPEALRNYLLRLGWSHADEEIISDTDAKNWFNLESIIKSPARLDFAKLNHLNHHYLNQLSDENLFDLLGLELSNQSKENIIKAFPSLKKRANNLNELKNTLGYLIIEQPIIIPDNLFANLKEKFSLLKDLQDQLENLTTWQNVDLSSFFKEFAAVKNLKLGDVAGLMRIILTGTTASISVFEIMEILSKPIILARLSDVFNDTRA